MSAVDTLRENDPERTSITIDLHLEDSDADLARALEQNSFIMRIVLVMSNVQTTNWRDLLRVIAMRANLETVELADAFISDERNAATAFVHSSFLRAIQQNTAIQNVYLVCVRLPIDVSTFLDTASSITLLSLWECDMEPIEREQGTRDLAAALQRNTNIKSIRLGFMVDIYAIPILQSLQANVTLTTLTIVGESFSDGTTRAIQQLLESTTSIEHFDVWGPDFSGDQFRPVSQGIMSSRSLSELKLSNCRFRDEESTGLFRSILQNKRNLTSLCLIQCQFQGGQVHETVISALSRSDSPLRSFEMEQFDLSNALPNGQFQQKLLQAVEKSKLEHFAIGFIQSTQQLRALADSIPLMRIKELQVGIDTIC